MHLLITGNPGAGKTTLIKEILKKFKENSGGFYTEEIRKGKRRQGFLLKTTEGESFIFARKDLSFPYKFKDYRLDIEGFEKIILPFLQRSLEKNRILIMDEIGKMELYSEKFKEILPEIFDSSKRVCATIHRENKGIFKEIKERSDVYLYRLGPDNFKESLEFSLEFLDSLSANEAKRLDIIAQEVFGLSQELLMENAGSSISRELLEIKKDFKHRIYFLCGWGNNGADCLVAARHLLSYTPDIEIFLIRGKKQSELNLKNERILKNLRQRIKELKNSEDLKKIEGRSGIYVDGIFGTGFKKGMDKFYGEIIKEVNKNSLFTLSVDIPSGLDASLGKVQDYVIRANLTLTFFERKVGFLINEGYNFCGKIKVEDLGIPSFILKQYL